MRRNQITLSEMPVEKNQEFLGQLHMNEHLERVSKWFDKLTPSSARRELDPNMNLEKFIGLMTDSFHIVLQTGSPVPDQIRYCACSIGEMPEIFAWVECPYNEHNYRIISTLFKRVYDQEIDSIPVHEALKRYDEKPRH